MGCRFWSPKPGSTRLQFLDASSRKNSVGLILWISLAATATSASGETAVIITDPKLIRVTVRKKVDDSNQLIKEIETAQELALFQKLWQKKSKTDALNKQAGKLVWPFSLQIEDSKRSTVWLLSAEGVVAPLSKTLAPAFQLADREAFFKLISE
jgi:hypothetical protein